MNKTFVTLLFLLSITVLFDSCEQKADVSDPVAIEDNRSLNQTVYADELQAPSPIKFVTAGAWGSYVSEPSHPDKKPAWISVSPDNGRKAGSYTMYISLEPNTTGTERTAIVTISGEQKNVEISVTQKATKRNGDIYGKMITFNVFHCITTGETAPQDNVHYLRSGGAEIKISRGAIPFGTYTTDTDGKITVALEDGEYNYIVTKGDEKNILSEGYVIAGIFSTVAEINNPPKQSGANLGDLKFKDINADGIIDERDKTKNAHLKVVKDDSVEVYIARDLSYPIPVTDYTVFFRNMNDKLKSMLKLAWQIDAAITREATLSAPFDAFSNFSFTPYSQTIFDLYANPYRLSGQANMAIGLINELSNAVENEKRRLLSETLFFRAYAYSFLLNYFGGVPIVISTPIDQSDLVGRSADEVANQIFSDLNRIVSIGSDTLKYMASQLEARVALNQGLYTKAFDAAKRIIDSRNYTLSSEKTWGSDAVGKGYELQLPSTMSKGKLSYPFRYAEILLIYAEAAAGTGNSNVALQTVNQLEQWQALPKTQSADTENIKNSINTLWSVILNNEGHGFAQLKRSGRFLELLGQYGAEEKHKSLPIPQSEINSNPNITQNPGW